MSSTSDILKSVIKDYKDIESSTCSPIELLDRCAQIRKSLILIIKQQLVNTAEIVIEIENECSQTQTVLNFFDYLIDGFPHPVFVPSSEQCRSMKQNESQIYMQKYKDFLFLLSSRLIQLLTLGDLKALHETARKILHLLIELIKMQNVRIYHLFLQEIVAVYLELQDICITNCSHDSMKFSNANVQLKSFNTSSPEHDDIAHIFISSFESLERWQIVCTNLVQVLVEDILVFVHEKYDDLFYACLDQILCGKFPLKIVSLKFCSCLVQYQNAISENVLHSLMSCIVTLMEYIFSDPNCDATTATASENSISYDEAVKTFLHDIFEICYQRETMNLTESSTHLHLGLYYLKQLVSPLLFHLKRSTKLDGTAIDLCNYIFVCAFKLGTEKSSALTRALIEDILKIGEFLIVTRTTACKSPSLKIALTNLFALFCFHQASKNQDSSVSVGNCKDKSGKLLSRKRRYNLDGAREKTSESKHKLTFHALCVLMQKQNESFLSEYQQVFESLMNCPNSKDVLLKLKHFIQNLTVLFEPFLTSMVISKENEACKKLHLDAFSHLLFATAFCKYVELFLSYLGQTDSAMDEADTELALSVFSDITNLAKLLTLWYQVAQNEETINFNHDSSQCLSLITFIFSAFWLEDLPWKDLKGSLASFPQREALLIFCRRLGLFKFSDECLSECKDDKKLSFLQDALQGLALIPGNIAINWRYSVITNWALSCRCDQVEITALESSLILCNGLKASNTLALVHDWLSYLKSKQNISKNERIVKAILNNLLPLTWVITNNFHLSTQALFIEFDISLTSRLNRGNGKKIALIDDDKLNLVNEIEKILFSHLTSESDASTTGMRSYLVTSLNGVLQYVDRSSKTSFRLLRQWLNYLDWKVDFDSVEPLFLKSHDNIGLCQWTTHFMEEAEAVLRKSLQEDKITTQWNLTILFGTLLQLWAGLEQTNYELFQKPIQFLCNALCSSNVKISSLAFVQLEKLTADHPAVLDNNRKVFAFSLATALVDEEKCRSSQRVLEDAARLFSTSLNNYVGCNMQFLLPSVILREAENGQSNLLAVFSAALDCCKKDLIKQNFKHVFCYAVTTNSDLDVLFKFLEDQTKLKKESLVLMTYGSLIQHLMAHVSVDSERVCDALQFVHRIKSGDSTKLPISELLKPHFLSVLTFFNSLLRLASVTATEKLQVYESLIRLLYLLDTVYVTAVFVKVVNTLCLAQSAFINSSSAGICCKAWNALARCVQDSYLGGFMSQVVVMLLPCLDKYPSEVASTLEYLVIEKRRFTKANFAELYFLPDHEALDKAKAHIDKELRMNKSSQATFLYTLEQANRHLSHDSAEVRLCALVQVRKVLRSNQKDLQRHCLIAGGVSDLVRSLILTLLSCCRDSNPNIKLLSAKCLGEIGAVDPDRLSLEMTYNKPHSRHSLNFDDEDFAFNLLNCLVQAFLVAKPSEQDISAFAIQELLKIYHCKDGTKDTQGRRLWRRFSEQTQTILEPHLSSRYVLKKSEINLATLKRPILYRKENMTFREWIGTFCAVLMQLASSVCKESTSMRGVFDACTAVVRGDVNVALFLLPSTIVEVLRAGDEHLILLQEEIMAVLKSTELLQDTRKSEHALSASLDVDDAATRTSKQTTSRSFSTNTSQLSQLSAQAVFSVIDHVSYWLHNSNVGSGSASRAKLREKEQASKFLSLIPHKKLALASLQCKDYTRALKHYEAYLRESPDSALTDDQAAFLQRIFIEINETDGVLGVVNVRGTEPTLETQLLVLESTGALQDAASCYERMICNDPSNVFHYKGFFKCLIDLGQLSEAVNLIDGTMTNHPDWKNDLTSYSIDACWRLGKWDLLEKKVKSSSAEVKSWSVGIGEAILSIRDKDWAKLDQLMNDLYQIQTVPLSVASMETNPFQRGYEHILRLHTLSDLERFSNIVRDQSQSTTVDDAMSLWQLRLQIVQQSFRACDPLLSLGRVLLPLIYNASNDGTSCDRHVGKLWLQSSKLARKSGLLQTAYGAQLSAQSYSLPGHCIEHAKWLWKKGESHQALLALQRGSAKQDDDSSSVSPERKLEKAKVMLLEAKLMEESSSYDSNVVLRKYKEVMTYMSEWEDSHFYCGRYYDKLMTTMIGENKATAKSHHLYYIMSHYGRSLCFGTSHIYESLTKLLTLWLDYGETAAKLEKAGRPQSAEDVQRLVEVIADVRSRLPVYIFYVAFSQLTSRICHQHQPTYNQLKEILISVILAFPQRALWSMMAISKSSFQQRAARCQEIFDRVVYKEPRLAKLLTDSITLTNRLLDLCNKPVSTTQPLSMATHFKQLKKLVEGHDFSQIMLPLQRFMNVVLPQTKRNPVFDSQTSHNPFPESVSHITGFDDAVEILTSLQRPKKISIRSSDGRSYAFLCKPKDDLRKDARLAEFAAIVNKCLHKDSESGKRHLRIRTYAVIPLNEECGLIEWVNNMKGLRHILLPIYKAKSLYCSAKLLKSWQLPVSATLQKKLEVFRIKFLPRHPPVFHEWFLATFCDPSSWYNARLAYARSVAVMSMVGYILGLGDRHGENILFDSNSGEAMHVDFNCLFNKGLSLEVPEIVPFRLTHNMVDAMGPTKYEGFFRKACEVTMNVLREQREPLMSVLKSFIYDPLVEWSKKSRGSATSSGEIITEKAMTHVNDIDKRLRGIVGKGKGLPLSIEGHVHYLIQEASDEEKLCQMYIGWAPFM